ncbi:MAG: SprT family zinc-dependent metalloprotease [Rhodospirillaceae bacterium]
MTQSDRTVMLSLGDGRAIEVGIRRSRRARRILLHVGAYDGRVELVLPTGVAARDGIGFARTQTEWLVDQMSRVGEAAPFSDGAAFPLLGETVAIRLVGERSAIPVLEDGILRVGGRADTLPGRVRRWIRTRALEEIEPRTQAIAGNIGRMPSRISVRDTRSRWGSCSRTGSLSFSWRLVMAPEYVLDYVVAHEVAHLRHLDHSDRFWSLVEKICPNHRTARSWLRRNGPDLHRYGRE